MISPALDTNADAVVTAIWSTSTGGSGDATGPMSTSLAPDTIIAVVAYEGSGSPAVSSITASNGIIFTHRATISYAGAALPNWVEIWWATAPAALSGVTFYATMSSNVDDACLAVFAVNGTEALTPFDPNVGLPESGTATGAPPTITFSTNNAADLLMFILAAPTFTGFEAIPSGWTQIVQLLNEGGINACYLQIGLMSVSSIQSGETVTGNSGGSSYWISAVDALTAGAPPSEDDGSVAAIF